MPLYLSNEDVRSLLSYADCVNIMEDLFRQEAEGLAENFPRQSLNLPQGFHRTMSGGAYGFGAYGFKTYGRVANPVRYLVMLFDLATGDLAAIMDAKDMGEIRTSAVSALGTKLMAREDAENIGIIGTGREARGQMAAMMAVRPIKRIKAYSRTAEKRGAFTAEMAEKHGIEAVAVSSAEACVEGADIVITVSAANDPVLMGEWLRPGMHVSAIGATSLVRRELDVEAVKRADLVVVENLDQARDECGELIWAAHTRGSLRWSAVVELHEVVSGKIPGRKSADQITLLDTLGVAAEDVAAGAWVLERAKEQGLGREIDI
jgi:ornithine cyclodeaminase/alanine dehydrogenase-like protein (mu-crystallin family)